MTLEEYLQLLDWTSQSLKTIRLRASTGKYTNYRRLSKWRVGPKQKPRVYYAYQEKCEVRSVGSVQLIFSTMKQNLKKATLNDVKILMTNALDLSVTEVIEMYSLRRQIELFFKELKSTLGFAQYSFEKFPAVEARAQIAITLFCFEASFAASQRLGVPFRSSRNTFYLDTAPGQFTRRIR